MNIFKKTILIQTKGLNDFIKITEDAEKVVRESKIKNGIVFLNSLHNTGALILQENDSTIHRDLISTLEKIVPLKGKYEHDYEGNENATAHLKMNLLGSFLTVPLEKGNMILGRWQDIFFIEFFEPRTREIVITIVGD